MKQNKNEIDNSNIHSKHYSLLANIRKAPWVASAPFLTAIRASIVTYTMLYMTLILTPPKLTKPFHSYLHLLCALYHILFPFSTILTSISGVDLLYIFHLLLLSINMDLFEVIHNSFSEPGFVQTYSIISIVMLMVNFIFFLYWSIPNRLLFINTFQIGVEVKAETPYNVLKRIGVIWFIGCISLVIFTLVIIFWPKDYHLIKLHMFSESEPYFRFTFILIIEYLMYKQCHPLYKYKLKNLIAFRGASDIIYVSIIITSFAYFCTILILGMSGLGVEWFMKHNDVFQLINLSAQILFSARFYFLWHLSLRDFAEESSGYENRKPNYPQWSWDRI